MSVTGLRADIFKGRLRGKDIFAGKVRETGNEKSCALKKTVRILSF